MINQFKEDVNKGLSSSPKFLSSRYFYDKIGDKLFVDIMNMPEYYLTDAEHEIFTEKSAEIIKALELNPSVYFELIELGAGDGTKTKELLKELVSGNFKFDYMPIDISQNALDNLEQSLNDEIPEVSVSRKQGDYFRVLDSIKHSNHPKVVLFLGSNMGNLLDKEANEFLYRLGASLNTDDKLLLGVDLIKSEDIVLPAYDDANGITAKFNLNLLHRINKELDANFDLTAFEHQPEYTEEEGIAKSYLVSLVKQHVEIKSIGKTFQFEAGEKIHTEISRKYNSAILEKILLKTDFEITGKLTDSRNYFADFILRKSE